MKLIILDSSTGEAHVHSVEPFEETIPERDYEDAVVELGYKLTEVDWMVVEEVKLIIH